jgi:hypothetical protein
MKNSGIFECFQIAFEDFDDKSYVIYMRYEEKKLYLFYLLLLLPLRPFLHLSFCFASLLLLNLSTEWR